MEARESEKFKAWIRDRHGRRPSIRHSPAFRGLKVRSFRKVATVPKGKYSVVIRNSENLLMTMIVRVRIVADPE